MGLLEFISKLIESIAWPLTAVIIIILLREKIGSLILKEIKYKDLTLKLDQAEKEAASLPRAQKVDYTVSDDGQIQNLLEVSPASAIAQAWLSVEATIREAIAYFYPDLNPMNTQASKMLRQMESDGLIQVPLYRLATSVKDMRNKAVHASDASIDKVDAIRYVRLAKVICDQIRQEIKRNKDQKGQTT